jgi:hypothetical protein
MLTARARRGGAAYGLFGALWFLSFPLTSILTILFIIHQNLQGKVQNGRSVVG